MVQGNKQHMKCEEITGDITDKDIIEIKIGNNESQIFRLYHCAISVNDP